MSSRPPARQSQFTSLRASSLYCQKCKDAKPVRERLLLVLPDKEIYDYLCTICGSSVGQREVTAAEKSWRQPRRGKSRGGHPHPCCCHNSCLKIAYLGSGDIGLPTLRTLIQSQADGQHEVLAVVTQPDRPVGRHQTLTLGPIKTLALGAGIPVLQPERIRRPEGVAAVQALGADVCVVFAYGQILPPAVLEAPRLGCLNLHASLLPKYRGAAPIQAVVLAGERESGLTVMYMDVGLDTGDVLREHAIRLRRRETAGSLHDRLADLAPGALLTALDDLAANRAPRQPQDHSLATHAPKLTRESGCIDWTCDHTTLDRFVRGMHPWPGAWTLLPATPRALTLKIHSALPVRRLHGAPGEIVLRTGRGIFVAAGQGGGLLLREVQLEGKRRVTAEEFARGRALPPGLRLG